MAFDTSNYMTLRDLAAIEAGAPYDIIQEAVASAKELEVMPAETIPGTSVELSVCTGLPDVGFSRVNEGVTVGKPVWATKLFQALPLTAQIPIDRRALGKNPARTLAAQSIPHMAAVLKRACGAFWYGGSLDAKAPPGIIAQASTDSAHVTDFGGSTQTTSVFFMKMGAGFAKFLFGDNKPPTMGEWKEETLFDSNDKPFPGLVNWIDGRVGAKLENVNGLVRIKKISLAATAGVYTNKLTDAAMYGALAKMQALGFEPDAIFAHPFAMESLRQSRITDNIANPPYIKEFEGVPVIRSINISTAENSLGV